MITDPRSSLTENYGNEIESKGVQFPGRGTPDKINRGGLQSPLIARKFFALVPQEHQIRMRSDGREKAPCTKLNFCLAMQTTI